MAATIATAIGHDPNRDKTVTRLGHHASSGFASTWYTFTECHVRKDGSGYVEVRRGSRGLGGRVGGGDVMHRFDFGPESEKKDKHPTVTSD